MLNRDGNDTDYVNFKHHVFGTDGLKNTPLHVASAAGSTTIVELLVNKTNVKPDVKDSEGFTAAHRAAETGNLETLKILVEKANSDINMSNGPAGNTVIMAAINRNRTDIVTYLIPHAVNINEINYYSYTYLYEAVGKGNMKMVKDLVLRGKADVNAKNGGNGWTATMRAAEAGALNMFIFLIEEGGADPNIKDNFGYDALLHATKSNKTEIVRYLLNNTKVNVNGRSEDGDTSLYIASQYGLLEIVKLLVSHTDIEINSKNLIGYDSMPFAVAAQNGQIDVVRHLLNHGAKAQVNYLNLKKYSALQSAVVNGHEDVVKLLVETGHADVEIRNSEHQWTALQTAAYNGYLRIVKYLLEEAGANVTARTGDGRDNAESLSENNGRHDITQYLRLAARNY